jgi:hypothetical protein
MIINSGSSRHRLKNKTKDVYMDKSVELFEELKYAKDAVLWLLAHENGNVDSHSIAYWASEVERLRKEIKNLL